MPTVNTNGEQRLISTHTEQMRTDISDAHPSPRRPIRIAVVGAGKMATNHVRAITRCGIPTELVSIADPSEAALASLGALVPSASRFASLRELLASESVDVVHVCTPPIFHGAMAAEALEAGCHVYVEKPFAETTEEAEKILAMARARGLKVAAGHQLLHERPTRIASNLVPSLGRLTHVESYFSFRTVRRAPGGRVPLASDLQLLDILPHPVYLLLHFLDLGCVGRPELIALDLGEAGTLHALIRQGHLTASLVVTLEGRPVESYVRLVGTNGSVVADYIRGTVQRHIGPGTSGFDKVLAPYRLAGQLIRGTTSALTSRVMNRQGSYPGLTELFDSFYASIRDGRESPITDQNIRETTRLWERVAHELRAAKRENNSPTAPVRNGVLVTGGTGLLGRAIAQELAAAGRSVRVVSRREPAAWEKVAGVHYAVADLSRPLRDELFEGISGVIHAAAETAGGWTEHQRNSLDATGNVLRAAAAAGVKSAVHVSSLAVLTRPGRGEPIRDDAPLLSNSRAYGPYVWGKLESERLAIELGRKLGLPVKVARPGPLVDARNFEPPGRLGRRIGNFFIAVGAPGHRLPMTDVVFAAQSLVWLLDSFPSAPDTLNLLDPVLPTKRDTLKRLKIMNPDISVIWLPTALLIPLSWTALLAQKLLRPGKPAMNIAQAFASGRYDTSLVASIAQRMKQAPAVLAPNLDIHSRARPAGEVGNYALVG
jgi:predicted dehydrogenase/nucleoside-diphosphate-sugar epimerase